MHSPIRGPRHRLGQLRRAAAASPQSDYTKTRAYAAWDLAIKSVSAVALILVGIVGWRLQQRVADTRDAIESRERQERRYLPMLRTVTELEIALESVASDLGQAYDHAPPPFTFTFGPLTDVWHVEASRAATKLRYAANSLYLPDGEVTVPVVVPRADLPFPSEGTVTMPLRAAVLMYADWITSAETFLERPNATPSFLTVDESRAAIDIRSNMPGLPPNSVGGSQWVDRGALPAWRIWLNTHEVRSKEVPYPFPPRLLRALRIEVAAVVHKTLREHPDVADRYVAIRRDAIHDTASAK